MTGIRWEEGTRRATRTMFEYCRKDRTKKFLHPLCDWTWQDIWTFIHKENIPYCELYDPPYNFKRIGCIGCPFASTKERQRQFRFFPNFKKAYLASIKKLIEQGKYQETPIPEQVFDWWISRKSKREYMANVLPQQCLFA